MNERNERPYVCFCFMHENCFITYNYNIYIFVGPIQTHLDQFTIELGQFTQKSGPVKLFGNFRHSLRINVLPVNSIPFRRPTASAGML